MSSAHTPYPASSNIPTVSDESLMTNIDIGISIIILVLALFNAPRAVARFTNRSEWFQGVLLRHRPLTHKPRINLNTQSIYLHSDSSKPPIDLDHSTTSCTTFKPLPPAPNYALKNTYSPPFSSEEKQQQPVHVPTFLSVVHPLANILTRRVHGGYTIGHVLLIVGYTAIVFYAGFYKSNLFADSVRAGWIVASQIPFLYAFATKNNVIGMLLGVGYEKVGFRNVWLCGTSEKHGY